MGFFLGGYIAGHEYFGFKFSNFMQAIFSVSLLYFSWVQKNYVNLAYHLSLEKSKPSITSELDESEYRFFTIRNVGETSAYNTECRVYNYTIDEEYEYELIEELYSKSSQRLYFPIEWSTEGRFAVGIFITYCCDKIGEELREYSEEIQY